MALEFAYIIAQLIQASLLNLSFHISDIPITLSLLSSTDVNYGAGCQPAADFSPPIKSLYEPPNSNPKPPACWTPGEVAKASLPNEPTSEQPS